MKIFAGDQVVNTETMEFAKVDFSYNQIRAWDRGTSMAGTYEGMVHYVTTDEGVKKTWHIDNVKKIDKKEDK